MQIWKKLFGMKSRAEAGDLDLSNSNHPARKWIWEAARIADESISLEYANRSVVSSRLVILGADDPLIKAIDEALTIIPNHPDLLFAKSEAYYARLDGETGQKVRSQLLALAPTHFDAIMRERHFQEWDCMFMHPGWNERTATVSQLMVGRQNNGLTIQIVRDGLKLTLAILVPTVRSQFPAQILESCWKPIWVDTPFGPVFAHYGLLKLPKGKIHRQEMMMSPYPQQPIQPFDGDWLIRRLCNVRSVFLVFNEGREVLYNKRYIFPDRLMNELATMAGKLDSLKPGPDNKTKFKSAANWYMQNSDFEAISF